MAFSDGQAEQATKAEKMLQSILEALLNFSWQSLLLFFPLTFLSGLCVLDTSRIFYLSPLQLRAWGEAFQGSVALEALLGKLATDIFHVPSTWRHQDTVESSQALTAAGLAGHRAEYNLYLLREGNYK